MKWLQRIAIPWDRAAPLVALFLLIGLYRLRDQPNVMRRVFAALELVTPWCLTLLGMVALVAVVRSPEGSWLAFKQGARALIASAVWVFLGLLCLIVLVAAVIAFGALLGIGFRAAG